MSAAQQLVKRIGLTLTACLLFVGSCFGQEPFSERVLQLTAALQSKSEQDLNLALAKIDPQFDLTDQAKVAELRRAIAAIPPAAKESALLKTIKVAMSEDATRWRMGLLLLNLFGEEARPKLTALLKDPAASYRAVAISGLAAIGWDARTAVPELMSIVETEKNSNVRAVAVSTLGSFGPNAVQARNILLRSLHDEEPVRSNAAVALGNLYSQLTRRTFAPSEQELVDICRALQDQLLDRTSATTRQAAAQALGMIKADLGNTIPALTTVLRDPDSSVRAAAAYSIGVPFMQPTEEQRRDGLKYTKVALPELIRIIQTPDENAGVKSAAAGAITFIGTDAVFAQDTSFLSTLEEANTTISQSNDPGVRQFAGSAQTNVRSLQKQKIYEQLAWLWYFLIVGLAYILLLLVCVLLLFIRPLWIFRINQRLLSLDQLKLPDLVGGMRIPVRYFLLIGFFHYHRRILDAWVASKLPHVRQRFQSLTTVKERAIHIPVPVVLEGVVAPELDPRDLQPFFKQERVSLLIWGEGGGGKTSLACQIASWAMSADSDKRLCPHAMIPLLIEQEFDHELSDKDADPFVAAINGALRTAIGDPEEVSEELLKRLLLHRRLLVIVDHFSEFNANSRARVRPKAKNFSAYALLVTSRIEEELDQVPTTVIRPVRVEGNRLSTFMESYLLRRCSEENVFTDAEKFDAYSRLSSMVGDRDVTVLLAKLFAEQMIALKRTHGDNSLIVSGLPANIPDLMLSYLNELNRDLQSDGFETTLVHTATKKVAWLCLKDTYRPSQAKISEVITTLDRICEGKKLIEYLEKRLRLVQTMEPAREYVRFTLDPLAEYLAGLHITQNFGKQAARWEEFLNKADESPGAPVAIKEFLSAVRDCCLVRGPQLEIPQTVIEGLSKRVGLDPDALKQAQIKQRLQRLTSFLMAPEEEDRLFAVQAIGRMGKSATNADKYLSEIIQKDPSEAVRQAATLSLKELQQS